MHSFSYPQLFYGGGLRWGRGVVFFRYGITRPYNKIKNMPQPIFKVEGKFIGLESTPYTSKKDGQQKEWVTALVKIAGKNLQFAVEDGVKKENALSPYEENSDCEFTFIFKTFKSLEPTVSLVSIQQL